jgi:hypothetical protein
MVFSFNAYQAGIGWAYHVHHAPLRRPQSFILQSF